jgi:hypothetical protein
MQKTEPKNSKSIREYWRIKQREHRQRIKLTTESKPKEANQGEAVIESQQPQPSLPKSKMMEV